MITSSVKLLALTSVIISGRRIISDNFNEKGEFVDNKSAHDMLDSRIKGHKGDANDMNMHILEEGDVYGDYDEDYQWDEVEENDYDGTDADHKVREILKRMDKDKNQKISHEELLIWVFRAFHSVDVVDIAEEDFDEMDVNDDKKISWHEYLEFEFADLKGPGEDFDKNGKIDITEQYTFSKEANRLKSRFFLASNPSFFSFSKEIKEDTTLTLDEFKVFMDPFKTKKFADAFKSRVLTLVDTDKDGRISEKEFQNDWAHKPTNLAEVLKEETESKLSEHFELYQFLREQRKLWNDFDINKNGFLEAQEITLWLSPQNAQIATEEVELLFELVGNKHPKRDGELMFHEIIEVAQDWVDQTSIIRDGYFHHKEL